MDEDRIIAERISGKGVRAIAKSQGVSVAHVNHVIDTWVEEAIDDQLRKRSLCLELKRLDQLMEVFYRKAFAMATCNRVFWSPS
jgi:transposase